MWYPVGKLNWLYKLVSKARTLFFSGVGKTEEEITLALKTDILQFNVESLSELKKIAELATSLNKEARVAFRMNPDIDLKHPSLY